jgi:hypothetical protein
MTWMTVFCTLYLYTMEFSGGKPAWAFGKHQGYMRFISYSNAFDLFCDASCRVHCNEGLLQCISTSRSSVYFGYQDSLHGASSLVVLR